jgi:hypothetical protein
MARRASRARDICAVAERAAALIEDGPQWALAETELQEIQAIAATLLEQLHEDRIAVNAGAK